MPGSVIVVLLVGAWLVVLVPMLAQHRRQVRRASDAVLATRVLYRGNDEVRLRTRRSFGSLRTEDTVESVENERRGNGAYRYGGPVDTERVQSLHRTGRGGYDPAADAVARRARFAVRQRVVAILAALVVLTLVIALFAGGAFWWAQVLADLALVGYLGFLRRQTRIEQGVRNRRLARIDRARQGVDVADAPGEEVPRRLRRPGAHVVEIDDEDPAFAELAQPRQADHEQELPRASGQ